MRYPALLAALLLAAGCAGNQTPDLVQCTDPRPQVCTMEYNPACGELIAGGQREYSSPCNACADDTVAGYNQGSCPEA